MEKKTHKHVDEEKEVKKNKMQTTSETEERAGSALIPQALELQTYKSTPMQVQIKQNLTWILPGLALLEMTLGCMVSV